ncbi:tripartite motif-containing protein 16-like isoform X1 [Acipenser ruthenus]|uniref:tripartite motif-containing protein 16-like isoform X1 n=1 Tax=Acipenser ruthenus TaxID=7906 RepID=UPI00274210B6|nr:tripartite motif-containing protein 16-like isoform X1 [Acipenser ruthenus]
MAEANILVGEDHFSCPVCLDILKNPVAIPCGHSYCMGCIKNCWDQTDHIGIYSCPECRETFTPRPVLRRNTMLAEVVEKLKKTGLKPPPAQNYARLGDVRCDFCTGRKFKAVKSCLTCLASYCETHVKPHYEAAAFKRHKLVDATGNLDQKLCAEHQKMLDGFCRTDQMCICWLCADKKHKSHDTVSADTERTAKQKQLRETQAELQQRILERLKELGELKQAVHLLKSTAQTEIKESKMIFTALIRSIKRVRAEVLVLIEANEKASVNQAEGLIKRLEQEIDALRRRNAELKQLSETEDHIHFLQNFQALCAPPVTGDLPSVTVNPNISSGTMRKVVAELKEHIEDFCKGELSKMTKTVNEVAVYSLQDPEPRTRAEFLKYSRHLTLDPNTAHRKLHLSDGNRKVTRSTQAQRYPDHPERFDRWTQVLCRESLSGTRCYWEVEWSGGDAFIGVTYKGINRKGGQYACVLGRNDISCSLYCSDSIYTARHNNKKIEIIAPYRRRIGVYLDFTAASLSFYGVSGDSMMFLHTFQTTFTEPLYPGFWLPCVNSSVTICKLN